MVLFDFALLLLGFIGVYVSLHFILLFFVCVLCLLVIWWSRAELGLGVVCGLFVGLMVFVLSLFWGFVLGWGLGVWGLVVFAGLVAFIVALWFILCLRLILFVWVFGLGFV